MRCKSVCAARNGGRRADMAQPRRRQSAVT
jgi:hypothetical protein